MQQTKPKICPTVAGMPAGPSLCAISVAFGFWYFIGGHPLFWAACALVFAGAYRHIAYKNYLPLKLPKDNPLFSSGILVKGLDQEMLAEIDQLIEQNLLVQIHCPKHPFLRRALAFYVTERLGIYEFGYSERLEVEGKKPGRRSWLLSFPDRSTLQRAIDLMMQRGWQPDGDYRQESNLISVVHTQRMIL